MMNVIATLNVVQTNKTVNITPPPGNSYIAGWRIDSGWVVVTGDRGHYYAAKLDDLAHTITEVREERSDE